MRLSTLALLLAAPVVSAEEAPRPADKVNVRAEVVLAAKDGNEIDPPARKAMQQALAEKKVVYGYLKRVVDQPLTVTTEPVTVKMPNGKDANVMLEKLEKDVATLRVKVPPADATYTLGKTGNLYVQGGKHEGKDVWLVL